MATTLLLTPTEVVVAQLAEQSLGIQEIHGSNLTTGKTSSVLSAYSVEKTVVKKRRPKRGRSCPVVKGTANEREKNENQKILGSPPGLGDI